MSELNVMCRIVMIGWCKFVMIVVTELLKLQHVTHSLCHVMSFANFDSVVRIKSEHWIGDDINDA